VAIVGLGFHEVVGPLRPKPDAGATIEPEPASWPLFSGHFKPYSAPDTLHPVAAYVPPIIIQQ
jgi:hypothetical protein